MEQANRIQKIDKIASNKDLDNFLKETINDIAFGVLREDEAFNILIYFVKHISKKAISKHFKRIEAYRKENFFITLLCAGEKGYFTHITNGGDSLGDFGISQDPEESLKVAFKVVDHYKKTGEKLGKTKTKVA